MRTYRGKPITVWSVWSDGAGRYEYYHCDTFRDKGLAKKCANRLRKVNGRHGYTYYIRPSVVVRCRYRDW